jgi:hypothetical protein
VGAGRSGTTLLRLMLNEHPDVAIPSESHFIAPLIAALGSTATLSGASLEEALSIVIESPEWKRDFGHTPDELRAHVGDGPLRIDEFVDRVFRLEVGPEPAHWGDKTPANLYWVGPLMECFPNAHTVAIVRDPRDVYLSLRSLEWFGDDPWTIGRYIAGNGQALRKWLVSCPPEQLHVVRYEDLVSDAETTLRRLCRRLNLSFEPAMVEFHQNTLRNVQQWELDTGIHEKLLRPPESGDIARWRREGSRLERVEVEAVTAEVIDTWGYERSVAPVWRALLREGARVQHHLRDPGTVFARNVSQLRRRVRKRTRGTRSTSPPG